MDNLPDCVSNTLITAYVVVHGHYNLVSPCSGESCHLKDNCIFPYPRKDIGMVGGTDVYGLSKESCAALRARPPVPDLRPDYPDDDDAARWERCVIDMRYKVHSTCVSGSFRGAKSDLDAASMKQMPTSWSWLVAAVAAAAAAAISSTAILHIRRGMDTLQVSPYTALLG